MKFSENLFDFEALLGFDIILLPIRMFFIGLINGTYTALHAVLLTKHSNRRYHATDTWHFVKCTSQKECFKTSL
jgi:hypothetical protein